jgi:hypothetical protein
VSRSSGSHAIKKTIPPTGVLQSCHVEQVLPLARRVQPSRVNRSNRMAEIMVNIEDNDDSRTAVPQARRKKRQIIESDSEDALDVPEEIGRNPMAPVKKKRKQLNVEDPPRTSIPHLLPLQTTSPAQVPPKFRANPKPRHASRSQFHPQSQSQDPRGQSHCTTTYNPTNLSGIPDVDDPMQDDHQEQIADGWFYFS